MKNQFLLKLSLATVVLFLMVSCSKEETAIVAVTQVWAPKNLDVVTYSDGTPIPQITRMDEWLDTSVGAWCHYNNDPTNDAIYGKLYNRYAVQGIHDRDPNTPNKSLAPIGYHIPTVAEWDTFLYSLDHPSVAGGKMKEMGTTHWKSPNTGATNSSNFMGLPGGIRSITGSFSEIGEAGYWWSADNYVFGNMNTPHARTLRYDNGLCMGISLTQNAGCSVRCLKD